MKILKSWLLDYVKTEISDKDLIDKIIFSGTEVEGVFGELDENIVIVEIKKIDRHPNADRLQTVVVNDGTKDIQIVCGANNIEVGQRVPLAKPGAKIGDMEIAEATIRGVNSSGMLCSEKELGLGEDHTGIKILASNAPLGERLSKILESDIVLDIKPTPNRGDCLCHLGMAREVAATIGDSVEIRESDPLNTTKGLVLDIDIKDPDLCPRYGARIIKGIKIGPSPAKIADRLIACGMKPINNIVDITNYVMLDLGQPMHAFDATKIKDNKIIVRRADDNEQIVCLDDKSRYLTNSNLTIADFEKPIAIAGIIGGKDSEITTHTKDIILEAAEFDSKSIRKTAKDLEIVTEASYRFERGIDSSGIKRALDRASALIMADCGADEVGESIIVGVDPKPKLIEINHGKINEVLGMRLKDSEIEQILINLGFKIEGEKCVVPAFRHDIVDWRCLSEEVGRIYGYDNIPNTMMKIPEIMPKRADYFKKEYIKDLLVDLGFTEVYNYSFMSEKDIKEANISGNDLLVVKNPVQPENKYMRNSLIPGLLKSVAKNPTFDPVLIFEVGNVFNKSEEITMLGVTSSGKNAKQHISQLMSKISEVAGLSSDGIKITEIARGESEKFKIKKPITYIFEIQISSVISKLKIDDDSLDLKIDSGGVHYRPISKYPSITRDLAFVINKSAESSGIINNLYSVSKLINRVELFDEFESDRFGKDKKNVAFHIYLQAPDRTLNDKEAEGVIKRAISTVENKFSATLRS